MDKINRLERQKKFLIQISYLAVWGALIAIVVKYVGSVVWPFVVAFIIAWGLSLVVDCVTEKLHIGRGVIAVATVILFYGILAGLFYLLGTHIVDLMQGCTVQLNVFLKDTLVPFFREMDSWGGRVMGESQQAVNALQGGNVSEMATRVSSKLFDGMSRIAVHIPGICMNIFLTMIATLFIELEFPEICAFIARQIPTGWMCHALELKKYVIGTLGKYLLSYSLILLLTFAELTVGLLLLQIKGAVVIALMIAILDIFPILGTGTILLPWAVIASASGSMKLGLGLVVLYLTITVVRNIVEPHLVGKQIGLSPIVTLISIIVGLRLFGVVGLILFPMGVALIKSLNDNGVIHIFRTSQEEEL